MTTSEKGSLPPRSPLVLFVLILVASVANVNLAVATVALPEIGRDFDSSQTQLNLIAVAYSRGLAASGLCLDALGDRYGRKTLLVLGMALPFRRASSPDSHPTSRSFSAPGFSGVYLRVSLIPRRWR